jgi:hypothetical protein
MVFLPPSTNAWVALVMYNATHDHASFLIQLTSLLNAVIVMSLYISDSFFKMTLWLV